MNSKRIWQRIGDHLFCQPHMGRRCVVLLLSVTMMGLCVAIFDQIGFGTDPCSVLNLGVARLLGMQFGTYQLLYNCLLLLLLLALKEWRRIGLGSLANMVLVGYTKDFFDWVINSIHPLTGESLMVRVAAFAPAMALFLVAVSFYMVVELGVAPYDAIPQVIAARQKRVGFSTVRVIWDVTVTVLGFLAGSTVGVVTVITGFCLGPIITAIANRFRKYFI